MICQMNVNANVKIPNATHAIPMYPIDSNKFPQLNFFIVLFFYPFTLFIVQSSYRQSQYSSLLSGLITNNLAPIILTMAG